MTWHRIKLYLEQWIVWLVYWYSCNVEYGVSFMGSNSDLYSTSVNGPLARFVKSRVAHAPGMPGTFSPPPRVSDPDMHHGTFVSHVPWCMPGSLTSGFLWSRWRGKRSRHSRRMRNPQFYVSGKRPMQWFMSYHVILDHIITAPHRKWSVYFQALWLVVHVVFGAMDYNH